MSGDAFEFACDACGWEGADATFDAHMFAWCPRCGRPAEFKAIVDARRAKRAT